MSDNKPVIPQVEIIENGIPVSQERVDPNVVSFIFQAAQAAQLVKLRKLEESKVPIGVKALKYTITDTTKRLRLYPPWISFSLIHATTSGLTLWINDEAEPAHKNVINELDETFNLDMTYPVIKTLYLKAEEGKSCETRIYGKEGRPEY